MSILLRTTPNVKLEGAGVQENEGGTRIMPLIFRERKKSRSRMRITS